MSLEESQLLGHLEPLGWRRPVMIDGFGHTEPGTYRSGETCSTVDDIILSPNVWGFSEVALVTWLDDMQHATLTLAGHGSREDTHPVMHPPTIPSNSARAVVSPVDWEGVEREIRERYDTIVPNYWTQPWFPAQQKINEAWSLFLQELKKHLITCHVDSSIETSPTHAYGRPWQHNTKNSQRAIQTLTQRDLMIARRATHRLIAVARGMSPPALLHKVRAHAQVLCDVLALDDVQFSSALENPERAAPLWKGRLEAATAKCHRRQLTQWRNKLSGHNGRPTRALSRWLKQGGTRGHFVVKDQTRTYHGPKDFFQAHREYWKGLTTRDPTETVRARAGMHNPEAQQEGVTPDPDQEAELLYTTLQSLKPWSSSGMDAWPPSVMRLVPREACTPLAVLYRITEETGIWPSCLLDVRMQLVLRPPCLPRSCRVLDPFPLLVGGTDAGLVGD